MVKLMQDYRGIILMIFIFYLTLFLFIFGYGLYYNAIDNDFFARLIVGKTYFQTGDLLNWDFLSYTPTHRFVDHEWGSSLIFYFLQSHFGDAGLLIFKAIIYFAVFFLISRIILLHNKDAKMHFLPFLFMVNVVPGVIFTTLRCQSFSFFFFVLWLYTLERVRLKNETGLLWILPATMIIWGNLHGGCAAGFGLLVIYILGEFLNKKPVKKYIFTLILCFLALFINPYGFEYLKFLLTALTLKRELIVEWQGSFSKIGFDHHYRFLIFLGCFLVLFSAFWVKFKGNYKSIDKTKALLILITLLMAIKTIRLQPFFIFSICAMCYSDFYKLFSKNLPKNIDNLKEFILLFLMIIFAINATATNRLKCFVWDYPIMEVEFLKANNIKGNIMCEFHDGSYVAYKLYPNNLIFMDGKYEEVYPNNLIYVLKNISLAQKGWQNYLEKYPTDIIIASKKYEIFNQLKNSKDFTLMTQSPNFALFIKNKIIKRYYKAAREDIKYYIDTKYDTNINWSTNE